METLPLIAVLQLLQGTQPVPLETPCSNIVNYEESTGNEVASSEDNALILSRNEKNRVEWFYKCKPNEQQWSLKVKEGSTTRDVAEKRFYEIYEIAISIHGAPERSIKDYSLVKQVKINKSIGPFSIWNTVGNNKMTLGIDNSFFQKGKDKWSVDLEIVTNSHAICGGLFESKPCENK